MRRTKVIHVYLIFEKRNYYFSSVTGIFRHLSEDQIGVKQSTLSHNMVEKPVHTAPLNPN